MRARQEEQGDGVDASGPGTIGHVLCLEAALGALSTLVPLYGALNGGQASPCQLCAQKNFNCSICQERTQKSPGGETGGYWVCVCDTGQHLSLIAHKTQGQAHSRAKRLSRLSNMSEDVSQLVGSLPRINKTWCFRSNIETHHGTGSKSRKFRNSGSSSAI